jgi:DNA-binding SARP family transcriptional activator
LRDRLDVAQGITRVNLLRSFELRHNEQSVALPPAAQRLIAFLALERGQLRRVYIAGTLWIDYSQDAANANLRTALWRLRRLRYPVIDTTATHLALAPHVVVDFEEASESARRMFADSSACQEAEYDGVLSAGELLPDWYDDWVVIERERFRQVRLHALEALCYSLTCEGRHGKAIEVGLTAVAAEPLRESAHRAVMRAHLAEGNRGEALRQYEHCRRVLEPLGLEPSSETLQLRDRCAARDAAVTVLR